MPCACEWRGCYARSGAKGKPSVRAERHRELDGALRAYDREAQRGVEAVAEVGVIEAGPAVQGPSDGASSRAEGDRVEGDPRGQPYVAHRGPGGAGSTAMAAEREGADEAEPAAA